MSEIPEMLSEKSEMSAVEFGQHGLRLHVAPRSLGSVKARMEHARRVFRKRDWTDNRVKDVWYADPRIELSADEIKDIEEETGLRYGREEVRGIDELINRADALLESQDEDFHRPFVTAMRSLIRALASPRTEERERKLSASPDGGRR